jgi:G3E family GTPase
VFADRILLNKTDLVEADYLGEVEGRLRDINKVCDIIRCCKANVPLDKLLGIGAFDLKRIEAFAPDFLQEDAHDEHGSHEHGHTHTHHHHTHDSAISSVGILQEGSLDLDRLNSWMSKLLKDRGADIYRSKGVLSISKCPRPSQLAKLPLSVESLVSVSMQLGPTCEASRDTERNCPLPERGGPDQPINLGSEASRDVGFSVLGPKS